ncbi:UDP-N-acetylmuramoyl-L-alanine--D-glutamate ligase [Marinoscillum sp.]|uniref:UDP-N-acetylmuramoyl-L-alanine--D-glutamate ligase n=1 Tax=Marinoscillum sp. TaxID=2024838 RepID=UPI003BA861F5
MSKTITILGAGESGIGAAILGMKQGYTVFLSDAGGISADRKAVLDSYGVEFEEGGHSVDRILLSDEIIKSPGIPDKISLIQNALAKDIPVISEIEFAYRYIPEGAKVIAITGTNGKTTTTLLTHHLLKTAGLKVALGGNVGVSLARLVAEGGYDYYVVEVSSFQLDGVVKFKPDVAVLLNITPDHLDRYDYDFQKYVASKFRITENLTHEEAFVYCADSEPVTEEVTKRKIDACLFAVSTTKDPRWQAYMEDDHLIFNYRFKAKSKKHTIPVSEIALIGKHNMINSMSAVLSALNMDVSIQDIMRGLKTFANAPHRLEPCGEVDGVRFVNDSKATNVDAVYYALDGVKANIIWVAGGIDKGNEYEQIDELVKEKVKGIVCLGVDNTKLKAHFGGSVNQIKETKSTIEAVQLASRMAEKGDVVLLSPACASFDLFKNYEDRGDQFRRAVQELMATKKESV